MSFNFEWPRFSEQFHADAIQMLNVALNKGNKPPVIADSIQVIELEMGTQPPELEIRDIGELSIDQFRGIFRLTYAGDAHIVLQTKVQANPLNHKQPDIHMMTGSRGMLAAKHPLVVPMLLRLSHFKLSSYVVLVVSKLKGITLVFKTDPLQNVDINSTFDSIAVIQDFIQKEIEGQLRQMFREDLPSIIHRLSQQWFKAKVEAPSFNKRSSLVRGPLTESALKQECHLGTMATDYPSDPLQRLFLSQAGSRRSRSASAMSVASGRSYATAKSAPPSQSSQESSELDGFDPTYGLRPENIPAKSVFRSFSQLYAPNKGLADLAEVPVEDEEYDDAKSFDVVDWEDAFPDTSPSASSHGGDEVEYETIPAVGGGTITRPRIYHSQSQIQLPPGVTTSTSKVPPLDRMNHPDEFSKRGQSFTAQFVRSSSHPIPEPCITDPANSRTAELSTSRGRRSRTPDSLESPASSSRSNFNVNQAHSLPTPPFNDIPRVTDQDIPPFQKRPSSSRRSSISRSHAAFHVGSPSITLHQLPEADSTIVLRPSLNNTIHQLSTLSHSNHTLSPYTRSVSHFTVRSVPPRASVAATADRQPAKARRKRIYRLGNTPQPQPAKELQNAPILTPTSPVPPSEYDAEDLDRYFRSCDSDLTTNSPSIHPIHMRRRQPHEP